MQNNTLRTAHRNLYFIPLILIIIPLCLSFVPSSAQATAAKEIRVGIFEFSPICFLDQNDQPAGIYVDLINRIATEENWQIQYVFSTWGQALENIQNGQLDLLVSVAKTPKRQTKLNFSQVAVLTLWGEVYTRANANIENILDLQGKHIAVMKGDITATNFKKTAQAFAVDCNFIEVETLSAILDHIETGRADAGVIPNLFGITHHDEHSLIKTPIMFDPFSIYFATPKGNNSQLLNTIDDHLRRWKQQENSYYDDRLDFWLNAKRYTTKQVSTWLIGIVLSLLILALLFAVWVKVLRTQIISKTRALKKSKERYQAIFNSISDAIVIHDATTGDILDINETMLSMVGCTKEEALNGINILTQGEPPFSAAEAENYIKEAAQGEDQLFEWKIWRKNGSNFWCEVALKANIINDQKIIIAVARNIEDRKQNEDQLLHAHRMEAIGSLAGGIAHDFNNILTGIFGYTELAKFNQGKPEKLDEYLGEILTSAQRAKKLINQIQTFSKKHQIQKQPLQLSTVTAEVLKLLSSSIPSTTHVVSELQSNRLVHADPTQIHQVILNLCTNSSHAMEEKVGTLTVTIQDTTFQRAKIIGKHFLDAGDYVKLSITDTGHGIDPQIIKRIFDPYFTTKKQGKGTGLGLAMVQGIIESHSGGIEVQSSPDHGTSFQIYLPALQSQDSTSDQSIGTDKPLEGGNETILMVDDEEPIIKSISAILKEFGYTVHTFLDPTIALQTFTKNPDRYDLVLTDMTMPEITGAELAQHMLAQRANIPIIIATGNTEIISKENIVKHGIKAFCAKPISLPTLLKTVRQAMDN